LINEGNLGLIKATESFDHTKGFRFISHAVWWIRKTILQALAEQSRLVRLPLNQIGSVSKIKKAISYLEQEFEREPTTAEVANLLDINPTVVEEALMISGKPVSLDAPISSDNDGGSLLEVIEGGDLSDIDHKSNQESLKYDLGKLLENMTARQQEVLCLFFGLNGEPPMSPEEIGDEFDVSGEVIRRIKEKALLTLRRRSKPLKQYL
ncbi:MAG: RNA polymerase sigma factor RpoD/SigA, partial [Candidatus Nomurabacteria bacterium]|nr:RNA polymerase sigma factor RpoD/SigA [Candidatus Nomurabacteria bacterium]